MDGAGFALHVVHQQVLAEVVRCSEVGLAFAHLCNSLYELDQAVICGQHERVDHDAGALAFVHLLECLADDEGIKAEGIPCKCARPRG